MPVLLWQRHLHSKQQVEGVRVELDSKNLGRLKHVADPREVWTSESGDFTPWLAENMDVLADELGMTLTVVATEVLVGQFRLDIQAQDDDGRVVIIENQLEKTDHSHLGQCLVYAAGLEASTVIWVSRQFRDDFRRALDWLNERTDQGVQFFGVELGVVQIGDYGPRAPVFEVVSRPNDWAKGVKSSPGGAGAATETPLNQARQDLFAEILDAVNAARPAVRVPARNANNSWINFASGPFGSWGLAQINDGRLRVEAYLDSGDGVRNRALFEKFASEQEAWNHAVGFPMTYESMDGRRACRIATHHSPTDLLNMPATDRDELKAWATKAFLAMYDALDGPLRSTAKAVRNASVGPAHENTASDVFSVARPTDEVGMET